MAKSEKSCIFVSMNQSMFIEKVNSLGNYYLSVEEYFYGGGLPRLTIRVDSKRYKTKTDKDVVFAYQGIVRSDEHFAELVEKYLV